MMATTPFIANLLPPDEPIQVRLIEDRPASVELKLSVNGVPQDYRLGNAQAPTTPAAHSQQVDLKGPFYNMTVYIHEWGSAAHGAQVQVSAKEGSVTHIDTARVITPGNQPPIV